jgi:hypothetical protein
MAEEKRLRLINAELLEALKAMHDMTQNGWITPEDHPTDWQLGWEAACEQFKIARTNEVAEAAIKKEPREHFPPLYQAAPELLEALQAMLDSNERILKATGVCVFDKAVKEQAEAAIKKATGVSRG